MSSGTFISAEIKNLLADGGKSRFELFLLQQIKKLKKNYSTFGNPGMAYGAGMALFYELKDFQHVKGSYQFARLQGFLSQMLLAEGKGTDGLQLALLHIESAIEALLDISVISEEIIKTHSSFALFKGVILKALGQFDESINSIRSSCNLMVERLGASPVDLIMLTRQEVMMHQTVKGHRILRNNARRYRKQKPVEYYSTIKRVFEFAMNKGLRKDVRDLFSEFRASYAAVSHRLPPLSKISFIKNIGQYYLLEGQLQNAQKFLRKALAEASKRSLHGQARQIQYLLNQASGDGGGKLLTFSVE